MKIYRLISIILLAAMAFPALAQYDDIYYNPDKDRPAYSKYKTTDDGFRQSPPPTDPINYDDEFDNEEYAYFDDYDYYYTSRVRRFHRPYGRFDFFDPVYIDMAYYDWRFVSPGATVLIYDDPWSFRYANRWNRNRFQSWNYWDSWNSWRGWGPSYGWNSWGPGVSITFGWNNFSRWNNVGGWNSWGAPAWGWNSWNTWGPSYYDNFYGFNSNFYCPPSWGGGYNYNTVRNINNNNNNNNGNGTGRDSYYGPRGTGTSKTPREGSGRIYETTVANPTASPTDALNATKETIDRTQHRFENQEDDRSRRTEVIRAANGETPRATDGTTFNPNIEGSTPTRVEKTPVTTTPTPNRTPATSNDTYTPSRRDRIYESTPNRVETNPREESPRTYNPSGSTPRTSTPPSDNRSGSDTYTPRSSTPREEAPRSSTPSTRSNDTYTPRSSTPREESPRYERTAPSRSGGNEATPRSSEPSRTYTPSRSSESRSGGSGSSYSPSRTESSPRSSGSSSGGSTYSAPRSSGSSSSSGGSSSSTPSRSSRGGN